MPVTNVKTFWEKSESFHFWCESSFYAKWKEWYAKDFFAYELYIVPSGSKMLNRYSP